MQEKDFKASVWKWNKKFTVIVKWKSKSDAKDKLHAQWYSIMSIEESKWVKVRWKKFYFIISVNWKNKSWTIMWQDLFKVYLKLRDELSYTVKYIYEEENTWDIEKERIIHDLEEQYYIYSWTVKDQKKWKEKREEETKARKEKESKEWMKDFYIKKQLQDARSLLTFAQDKLKNILDWKYWIDLEVEEKEKYNDAYSLLIKIKKSSNISKIQQVAERALMKVWELELRILEGQKREEMKDLLNETNFLLKKVWSSKRVVNKKDNIKYQLSLFLWKVWIKLNFDYSFWWNWGDFDMSKFSWKDLLDKTSYYYLKNLSLLDRYKLKLKETDIYLLKHIVTFFIPFIGNRKKYEYMFLKKKVLEQNISLIKAKLRWSRFSYTSIVKWYNKVVEFLLWLLKSFNLVFFQIIFLYSLFFIVFFFYNYFFWAFSMDINYLALKYFILFHIAYLLITFSRWLLSLILSFVIFNFILIFSIINF